MVSVDYNTLIINLANYIGVLSKSCPPGSMWGVLWRPSSTYTHIKSFIEISNQRIVFWTKPGT